MQENVVQRIIIERIKQAQEEEIWIANLKEFLIGDITKLSIEEAKLCAWIALDYEVDEGGLLFFSPRSTEDPDRRMELMRLVVPELLQQDFSRTIIQVWRADTKVLTEHTNESGPNFTGEGLSIGLSSVMWENVLIARREKENLFFAANLRGMSKLLIRSISSRWITYRHYRDISKKTPSCCCELMRSQGT